MPRRSRSGLDFLGRRQKPAIPTPLLLLVVCLFLFSVLSIVWYGNTETLHQQGEYVNRSCWIPRERQHERTCGPQFIIAGTMKGGTTSLWSYLQRHPLVLPLRTSMVNMTRGADGHRQRIVAMGSKEIRFFNSRVYLPLMEQYSEEEAFSGYLNFFPAISADDDRGLITGEASPTYLPEHRVPKRIKKLLPMVKIIMLLRNPVDRAYSEYWFRQGYTAIGSHPPFRQNSRNWSDEKIFMKCMDQDLSVLEYCEAETWNPETPWLSSTPERCYRTLTNTLSTEQKADREQDDLTPVQSICTNSSHPLHSKCLPPEFYHFCNPRGAMLSLYANQLKAWYSEFPHTQMAIHQSEMLFDDPVSLLSDLEEFLHISHEPMDWKQLFTQHRVYNMAVDEERNEPGAFSVSESTNSDYPPLSKQARKQLEARFLPFNRQLQQLTGKPFW